MKKNFSIEEKNVKNEIPKDGKITSKIFDLKDSKRFIIKVQKILCRKWTNMKQSEN